MDKQDSGVFNPSFSGDFNRLNEKRISQISQNPEKTNGNGREMKDKSGGTRQKGVETKQKRRETMQISGETKQIGGKTKQMPWGKPKEVNVEKREPRKKFKRTIIIEPSFILMQMFHVASFPLFQQFLYFSIGEERGLNERMKEAAEDGLNNTFGPCDVDLNNSLYLLQQQVQAESAQFSLLLDISSGIPAIFSVLFYGTVVDSVGRKPGLILPIIGCIVRSSSYIFIQLFYLPLEVLFLSTFIESLCGGFHTYIVAASTFFADTVAHRKLGKRLSVSDVAYGFCLALMEIVMGITIQRLGFFWPFVLVVSGHLVNLVYVIFFVPETLDDNQKKKISLKFIFASFKILTRKREKKQRVFLHFFLVIWLICTFGTYSRQALEQYYKLNSPFCWSASLIGMYNGFQALITNLVQVFVAVFLLQRIGNLRVAQISCVSIVASFILVAFAYTNWMMMLVPVVGCFMGLQQPVMRAIMSGLVYNEERGAMFSVASAGDRLLMLLGSSFYNTIYAATLLTFKGTVFLIMAGFVLIGMVLLGIFERIQTRYLRENREEDSENGHNMDNFETKF